MKPQMLWTHTQPLLFRSRIVLYRLELSLHASVRTFVRLTCIVAFPLELPNNVRGNTNGEQELTQPFGLTSRSVGDVR